MGVENRVCSVALKYCAKGITSLCQGHVLLTPKKQEHQQAHTCLCSKTYPKASKKTWREGKEKNCDDEKLSGFQFRLLF